jgi:uncharacterized protein
MLSILKEMADAVPPIAVEDIIVGIFSTMVIHQNGCSIATTVRGDMKARQKIPDGGKLYKQNLAALAKRVLSTDPLEASIGLAAINSSLDISDLNFKPMKGQELILAKGIGKKVGIIGHFPFLEKMKDSFEKLWIFEKNPQAGDLNESDIPHYLPEADIAIITGTALINHSLESILKYVNPDAYKIMLGPSTPLSPLLFQLGFDALAGSVVTDRESLRHQVQEAVPVRFLKGIQAMTLFKDKGE